MIELLARGDRIRPGRYELRARFERAADYRGSGGWLALAEASLGRGPIRLSLRGPLPGPVRTITVERNGARLDGRFLPFAGAAVYRSSLDGEGGEPRRVGRNAAVLEDRLRRLAHPKSLAFLVDRRRERAFRSGFEKVYMRRMRGGWERIREGRAGEGAARMRGCGFGLTPSGDDFLVGLLAAFRLGESLGDGRASARRTEVRAALGPPGGTLSEAYLALAGDGSFPERLKDLAGALARGGTEETGAAAEALLASGATSGADTAAGVLLGLRPEEEEKREEKEERACS